MHIPDCSRRSSRAISYRPWGVVSVATAPKGFETILLSVRGRVAAREGEYNPERLPFGSPSPQRARRLACLVASRTLGPGRPGASAAPLGPSAPPRFPDCLPAHACRPRCVARDDVCPGRHDQRGVVAPIGWRAHPYSAADLPGHPAEHADCVRCTRNAPGHAADPQPVFQRPRLGCRHPARHGAGGALGVGADPRRVGEPAPLGRRRAAGRAVGDDGRAVHRRCRLPIPRQSKPAAMDLRFPGAAGRGDCADGAVWARRGRGPSGRQVCSVARRGRRVGALDGCDPAPGDCLPCLAGAQGATWRDRSRRPAGAFGGEGDLRPAPVAGRIATRRSPASAKPWAS